MYEIKIAEVKFHRVGLSEAVNKIEEFINGNQTRQVCVTNTYSVVVMQADREFKRANNLSSLVVADGMPIVWLSHMYKNPIPRRIAGADLLDAVSNAANERGYTFFFLGASEKILKRIVTNLGKKYPRLQIAGTYAPPFKEVFTEEDNREMIEKINAVHPDVLWVGLSAPKQEKWIFHNLGRLKVGAAIGVGAVFDFIAGTVKRAPVWMQRMGLEWLWRFFQEPTRLWRRYIIGNTVFLFLVLKEVLFNSWNRNPD